MKWVAEIAESIWLWAIIGAVCIGGFLVVLMAIWPFWLVAIAGLGVGHWIGWW